MKAKDNASDSTTWVTLNFQPQESCGNVVLKGEWDNWQGSNMRKKKDGSFYLRKKIPAGVWQCGFDCEESGWQIDTNLDTAPSPYNSLNNVITVGE